MINRAILRGYVADEPFVRATERGKLVRLRLATIEHITNPKSGQLQELIEWHTISLWGENADIADKKIKIADAIEVEGALRTRDWEDNSGKMHRTTEIAANKLTLLETIEGYTVPRAIAEKREQIYPSKPQASSPTREVKRPADDPDELPF